MARESWRVERESWRVERESWRVERESWRMERESWRAERESWRVEWRDRETTILSNVVVVVGEIVWEGCERGDQDGWGR